MEVEEAVRGAVLGVEAGQAAVQRRELPGVRETIIHFAIYFRHSSKAKGTNQTADEW